MKKQYPNETELKTIEEWKLENSEDYKALALFIISIWQYADLGYAKLWGRKLKLSTVGWSGNEDIIRSLRKSKYFFMVCWQSEHRGGHYKFELPDQKSFNKNLL